MNINSYHKKINLILKFAKRIDDENMPIKMQQVLLKAYANNLGINLTSKMVWEILSTNVHLSHQYTLQKALLSYQGSTAVLCKSTNVIPLSCYASGK